MKPIKSVTFTALIAAFIFGCASHQPMSASAPSQVTPTATHTEAASAPQHHAPTGVDYNKALGWLKNGNSRYIKGHVRTDGQKQKDRNLLTSGQHPHSIILSCSDSRVPPELIFDQKLGEIFVIRTAGEALDSSAIASIEYAVSHLGTQLIVVMGHTSCGAVTAALDTIKTLDAGSPSLNKLVADIHPRIQSFAGKSRSQGLVAESSANAQGVAHDLVSRSKIISDLTKTGDLKIVSALYHLNSGKVEFE